jgi:hydroxypyruvate isomerase
VIELGACIEWLFGEEPSFSARIGRAAAAGLRHVEFWTWRDKDLDAVGQALSETGIALRVFVSEPTGRLVDPSTHAEFVAGVQASAAAARTLGCGHLIVLSGDRLPGATDHDQRDAVIGGLRQAAPVAAEHGVTLLLEPLNTRLDHPTEFLDSTARGLDIVEAVAAENVRLLLDVYHAVMMGESPQASAGDRLELVGHVHAADVPGRHEPGTGTIDWRAIVSWLDSGGYDGAIGLEFMPARARTDDTLAHIAEVVG